MDWPPKLEQLKSDLRIDADDTRDDEALRLVLDASVYFVEKIHAGRYNFAGDVVSDLPDPAATTLHLGTIRLAGRWHERRRTPNMLVQMAELGAARVPSFDPDIDRLLRIGRHGRVRVG